MLKIPVLLFFKAGIWTNSVLRAADLPLLPLVTSIEQQTYYATPEGLVNLGQGNITSRIEWDRITTDPLQ